MKVTESLRSGKLTLLISWVKGNVLIINKQSKWHKAQPSATDDAIVLLLFSNLGRKHILMAQSEAEGPNF